MIYKYMCGQCHYITDRLYAVCPSCGFDINQERYRQTFEEFKKTMDAILKELRVINRRLK